MTSTPLLSALVAVCCGEADTVRPFWNKLSQLGWARYDTEGRFVATETGKAFARTHAINAERRTDGGEL